MSRSNKNKLILKYPAAWWGNMWREALPSGNGKIGAAVYGGIKEEIIVINHEELWHWGKKDPLPDVSHTLPITRKMMEDGNFKEASWFLTNSLREKGYKTDLASPLPLAALKVNMPCYKAFKNYRRILDMETGEVRVQWNEDSISFERTLFVSRAEDIIVYKISAKGGSISANFILELQDGQDRYTDVMLKEMENSLEVKAEENFVYYAGKNEDGTDFGAVLYLVPSGCGEITVNEKSITAKDSQEVLALLKVFVKSDRNIEWNRLKGELININKGYDELLQEHILIHKPLFESASIELGGNTEGESNEELLLKAYEGEVPTSLVEKMWAYGRYLFISATHPQGQPVHMYGLWGGQYRLKWSHHMANENVQMIYWHLPVGGLLELMPALFKYYNSMMEDFRDNAKKLYGCRGIYIPAGTTPGIGSPNQIVPVIMNWTGAAGWLAHHYYEYFIYTGDKEYLKTVALPFMKEVALFYEDFIVIGEDGYYKYYPSVSPENTPENFMPKDDKPLAHPMPTTINATMDFAIMKELLTLLVEGSSITGVYSEELDKWKEMIKHIPLYEVNEDGAIREWMHPAFQDRYNHRHLSHIYPVFPGQEISREGNPELFEAFEIAVKKRLLGAQSGWSLTHMACIYARFVEGDKALECLDILSRSCVLNNFYTLHNDWRNMGICMNDKDAPIQMDANMGFVAAVQEMLFYSSPLLVKLLPALPKKWNKGSVRDFRFCTGSASFKWDIEKSDFKAEFIIERDTDVIIKLPENFKNYIWYKETMLFTPEKIGENSYKINASQGAKLTVCLAG